MGRERKTGGNGDGARMARLSASRDPARTQGCAASAAQAAETIKKTAASNISNQGCAAAATPAAGRQKHAGGGSSRHSARQHGHAALAAGIPAHITKWAEKKNKHRGASLRLLIARQHCRAVGVICFSWLHSRTYHHVG